MYVHVARASDSVMWHSVGKYAITIVMYFTIAFLFTEFEVTCMYM